MILVVPWGDGQYQQRLWPFWGCRNSIFINYLCLFYACDLRYCVVKKGLKVEVEEVVRMNVEL